jgi:hypothetical protein
MTVNPVRTIPPIVSAFVLRNVKQIRRIQMKCPDNLTREDLWQLLGEYASVVGESNGVYFTDDANVLQSVTEYRKMKWKEAVQSLKDPDVKGIRLTFQ